MKTRRAIRSTGIILMGAFALSGIAWAHPVSPTAPAKTTPKPGGGLGDGITAEKVRHILLTDLRFDPSNIKVVSSSGVVALNGSVKTAQARVFAQADAQKAANVKRVINRLKVKP